MLCLAGVSIGLRADPRGDSWASVPASRQAGQVDSFVVAREPTEEVVAVVGLGSSGSGAQFHPVSVVGFGLELGHADRSQAAAPEVENAAMPNEAVWPGPDGRIAVQPAEPPGAERASGLRNPWEIRMRPAPELRISLFASGGVISGGSGGPVALLNGRIVTRGATVEGFEVIQVTPAATVLRRAGVLYAIPLGRRISIETPLN